MSFFPRNSAFSRVTALAEQRPIHAAFAWLHGNPKTIIDWQAALVAIPGPPFGEAARSEWLAARFAEIGLTSIETDAIGNVFGVLPAAQLPPESTGPVVLLSAHLDTVFKLMAGSAFRAPSIFELYYNDGGASEIAACATTSNCTALQPETVRSGELEWTHHIDPLWTALASAWGTRIENTIEAEQAPGQPQGIAQYQNTSAPIDGVGFELELRREWRQGWMVELNGSIQRLWFDQGSNPLNPLGEVPNSPEWQGGAKFAMPLIPRFLTLMTRVALESGRWDRDDQPGEPAQTRTPYGCIWDVSLSGQLPDWHARGSIGIYNIADWQTTQPLSSGYGAQVTQPLAGRRMLANLTFVF